MHLRVLFLVSSLTVAGTTASTAYGQEERPRLLVLLSVDQGRGDYLERFRPAFEGGLKWLLEEGVHFTDAHQFHSRTVTAAGHASISTGRHPGKSGMVGNEWYDRVDGRHVYCVEDRASALLSPAGSPSSIGAGRSPARLLVTGFGDWLKAAEPDAKVVSIGGKDRSAVLMGGKKPDAAFWFHAGTGHWVTSAYYASEYPDWVSEFHRGREADRYFGTMWEPLALPEGASLDAMSVSGDGDFAHSLGRMSLVPARGFYGAIYNSPFIESYMLDFARHAVTEHALGADETVDVLALSFASPDTVGHSYGPNSPEVLDTMVRLDRELGAFLDFLDENIGLENIAFSLSADHGVAPLPEYQAARGLPGKRLGAEDYACFQRVGRAFQEKYGKHDWFVQALHFNYDTVAKRKVERSELEATVAAELASCPSVERVWTRTELEKASGNAWNDDETLQLYVNSFHPERSPDLIIQYKEGYIDRARGTTHGTPYGYDTHVLTLVRWPGVGQGTVREHIRTVDLPVTLAALLGIDTPDELDGVDRSSLMRSAK